MPERQARRFIVECYPTNVRLFSPEHTAGSMEIACGIALASHGRVWGAPPSSMADEDRNFRVRKHLGGHAAEHDRRNAAAPVRAHDNEVATPLLGGRDDGFVRMVFF